MKLSRKALDAYNAAIKKQGGNAEKATRAALNVWLSENPKASIAEIREFCIALMMEVGTFFGRAAGDVAYALREIAAEAAGVELPDADYSYAPEIEYVRKTAKYQVGKLIDGDRIGFVDAIADASRYFAERGANDTMYNIGKEDAKRLGKRVRWARVPTGATTCPYCLMLASRGFVYRSEANALNANHRHCDCRIVEGFDGMTIEGYDPDKYYDMWKHPEKYQNQKQGIDQSSALSGANPNYSTGLPEWRKNCQRCVPTYEMRMRGNDVTALPRMLDANGNSDPNDPAAIHWREIFDGAVWERCNGTGKARIETLMASWGDGARAEVYVAWKGRNSGSHVFVAENRNGTVYYLDPQSGNADVSNYFKRVKIGSTQVARIDNLQPSQWMTHCCKGVHP